MSNGSQMDPQMILTFYCPTKYWNYSSGVGGIGGNVNISMYLVVTKMYINTRHIHWRKLMWNLLNENIVWKSGFIQKVPLQFYFLKIWACLDPPKQVGYSTLRLFCVHHPVREFLVLSKIDFRIVQCGWVYPFTLLVGSVHLYWPTLVTHAVTASLMSLPCGHFANTSTELDEFDRQC
jgi:hypothetical protein